MDIYELRKSTYITGFYTHQGAGYITYTMLDRIGVINMNSSELMRELKAIGSIDDGITNDEFFYYCMSQWDALNIAIRFELAREQQKELDNSDIFKAIANIIKPDNGQGDAY